MPVRISLDDIGAPPLSDEPDQKARSEEEEYERTRREIDLEGLKQDLTERKEYAAKIYCMICYWLTGMIILLAFQGFLSRTGDFNLSDTVIVAAIGGTTVNVLGIFLIVVNHLFPKR